MFNWMNPKINELIFKELIKRGYSLQGKTRIWNIADSKLWYLTPEQAQAYLDFIDSTEYQKEISPKEWTLLRKYLEEISKTIGNEPVNIVDLGCGNGRKASLIIEKINSPKVRYYPIDISGYMVGKAMKTVSKLNKGEVIDFRFNISDFENLENITSLFKQEIYMKNVFLLLGNTLGNFEIHELLYAISKSMDKGDFLIIGNGIDNTNVEKDIVKSCRENNFLNKFFMKIPLSIGIKKDEISWNVRFRNSRIEFYYKILKNINLKVREKEIEMRSGDELVIGFTYHYRKDELSDFLKIYFDKVNLKASEDGSYALAICKK